MKSIRQYQRHAGRPQLMALIFLSTRKTDTGKCLSKAFSSLTNLFKVCHKIINLISLLSQ